MEDGGSLLIITGAATKPCPDATDRPCAPPPCTHSRGPECWRPPHSGVVPAPRTQGTVLLASPGLLRGLAEIAPSHKWCAGPQHGSTCSLWACTVQDAACAPLPDPGGLTQPSGVPSHRPRGRSRAMASTGSMTSHPKVQTRAGRGLGGARPPRPRLVPRVVAIPAEDTGLGPLPARPLPPSPGVLLRVRSWVTVPLGSPRGRLHPPRCLISFTIIPLGPPLLLPVETLCVTAEHPPCEHVPHPPHRSSVAGSTWVLSRTWLLSVLR